MESIHQVAGKLTGYLSEQYIHNTKILILESVAIINKSHALGIICFIIIQFQNEYIRDNAFEGKNKNMISY